MGYSFCKWKGFDKVAPDISVPMGSALLIDGTGKYVTPGLIDCHSHSAASSINEGAKGCNCGSEDKRRIIC
ncbi:hypothetical protein Ct9H90mP29_14220 [bacterium]|nr:MAG: hypothetical protein Ct9H90mP29_14220 [bacterium]